MRRAGIAPRIEASHSHAGGPTAEAETRLLATPAAASAARRFIADTLEEWDADTAVDDAVLCGSELVTNAVLHAGGSLVVRLSRPDGEILLEVIDEVPLLGALRPRRVGDDNAGMTGRGLSVLASLATDWGVSRLELPGTGAGKVVWARLAVAPPEPHGRGPLDLTGHGHGDDGEHAPQEAELIDVPVRTFLESEGYADDVLRELQLAWWSHPENGALGLLASRLGSYLTRMAPSRATAAALARACLADGGARVNLLVAVDADVVRDAEQFLWTMDEIETLTRRGALLVPPPPPRLAEFRRWYVGELSRQHAGESPLPCPYV